MQFKDRKEFEERLSKCIDEMNEILEDLRKSDDDATGGASESSIKRAKKQAESMEPSAPNPKKLSGPQFPMKEDTEPEHKKRRVPTPNKQETAAAERESHALQSRMKQYAKDYQKRIARDVAISDAKTKKKQKPLT
jgi:hypothetical protein